MSGAPRSVRARASLRESRVSSGFTSFGLRSLPGYALDPFLNLDDFRMSVPTFPPHPHAGFSAVTYMFEDSPGAFVNRDSLGDRSRIGPGALHWTQAARGMMHEEIPEAPGTLCHGLQMFVNLRAADKLAPPRAFHLAPEEIPEARPAPGARVRVLAGNLLEARSPLTDLLTPILLLDVQLASAARVALPIDAPTCFVLTLAGGGEFGPAGARVAAQAHEAIGFADDGDQVELTAGADGLHLLLAAGSPIGEPVVFGGPFAMTARRDIDEAFARFERGEMGRLSPSF